MMTLQIYNHDDDIDVTHKINTIELDNWINHLQFIKKEVRNLIKMGITRQEVKQHNEDVLQRLRKKEKENDTLLNALSKYAFNRPKIAECDNIQCDMVFISEHEKYRRNYLYHLDKYKRLKNEFLESVRGGFAITKHGSHKSYGI